MPIYTSNNPSACRKKLTNFLLFFLNCFLVGSKLIIINFPISCLFDLYQIWHAKENLEHIAFTKHQRVQLNQAMEDMTRNCTLTLPTQLNTDHFPPHVINFWGCVCVFCNFPTTTFQFGN